MWGQKMPWQKQRLDPTLLPLAFFSGHAEAMLVLESMRHDNRAEGVSVDFRRGGGREFPLGLVHVKFWRSFRLLAECCCSGSCDYRVMFCTSWLQYFRVFFIPPMKNKWGTVDWYTTYIEKTHQIHGLFGPAFWIPTGYHRSLLGQWVRTFSPCCNVRERQPLKRGGVHDGWTPPDTGK